MPIKPCTCAGGGSGRRWGDHGHCYCGKGAAHKASKQAAAAYSHGYKGEQEDDESDGFGRTVRRLLEKIRVTKSG